MNISRQFLKSLDNNNIPILGFKNRNGIWQNINKIDLSYKINSCIEILKDNKIQKKDRIIYCGDNSIEWVAWNIASYSMGAIWVPIYNNQSVDYCNYIIDDCTPKLFITEKKNFNLDIKNAPLISNQIHDGNKLFNIYRNESLATLIYTSGTTGKPKGVKLSHENILQNISGISDRFSDMKNYKTLNILPWAHIYGLTCELYYNLLNDNLTYICNNKDNFIKDCKSVQPNAIFLVPKILELIKKKVEFLDKPIIKYVLPMVLQNIFGSELQVIFMGGARLDPLVKQFYEENNIIICEGYGCSETGPIISVNHFESPRDVNSVGKILKNVDVKIVNDEIWASGPNIMSGYWMDQLKTGEVLVRDESFKKWYKTGDSGYIKDDFLYYTGRISENYKLNNGKFVNVGEIETICKKYIDGNFIVYGENNEFNCIISDKLIEQKTINNINKLLKKDIQIKNIKYVTHKEMENFLTPKLSIKRNKLIEFVSSKEELWIK